MDLVSRVIEAAGKNNIVSISALSPQAVVVNSDSGEFDVYFSLGAYHLHNPKLWRNGKDSLAFPDSLRGLELGTLPGTFFGERVCSSIPIALKYAKEHLSTVHNQDEFFKKPLIVYENFSYCG
ncbi:MAG: hypothetical protein AABW73_00050 [Nanoarchaeota archaeon]